MELKSVFTAAAAALMAVSSASFAQSQSGSIIRSDRGISPPSTGTSADSAGAAATTAPRSPDTASSAATSVGASGATTRPEAAVGRSSGLCDTLTGDERVKCLREQATTGTAGGTSGGSAGAGSTGMGR